MSTHIIASKDPTASLTILVDLARKVALTRAQLLSADALLPGSTPLWIQRQVDEAEAELRGYAELFKVSRIVE
jgi:hypothetical protein